ncbi:MAG: cation:proton antiporter [Bacillota bacterium]
MTILTQLVQLLAVTMAGAQLAAKFKQPTVLGQLLADIIIGPAVLDLVRYSHLVEAIATVGVIFLMFLAGGLLELEPFTPVIIMILITTLATPPLLKIFVTTQESGVRMRKPAKTFEDLLVWRKAHRFVLAVQRLSRTFPEF